MGRRKVFYRLPILAITTLALLSIVEGTNIRRILTGMASIVKCSSDVGAEFSGYTWKINGKVVTTETSNIETHSINSNILEIIEMSQTLAGTYECIFDNNLINTIIVYIVGKAAYESCRDLCCPTTCLISCQSSCTINMTYNSNSNFILNANIFFINPGTPCCNEGLFTPVWTVKPNLGNFIGGKDVITPPEHFPDPGINVLMVNSSHDLVSNIAMVEISGANTSFQILHIMHTNITNPDSNDLSQISIVFNFSFVPVTTTSMMVQRTSSTTTSAMTSTSAASMTSTISMPSLRPSLSFVDTTNNPMVSSRSDNNVTSTSRGGTGPNTSQNENNNSNTGVIIAVVVVISVVIIIVIAVVVTLGSYHYLQKKRGHTVTHTSSVNGTSRPTTLNYHTSNNKTPLLDLTSGTVTSTTPSQINGVPMPYSISNNDNPEDVGDDVGDDDIKITEDTPSADV